jgi:hypothetical protein
MLFSRCEMETFNIWSKREKSDIWTSEEPWMKSGNKQQSENDSPIEHTCEGKMRQLLCAIRKQKRFPKKSELRLLPSTNILQLKRHLCAIWKTFSEAVLNVNKTETNTYNTYRHQILVASGPSGWDASDDKCQTCTKKLCAYTHYSIYLSIKNGLIL